MIVRLSKIALVAAIALYFTIVVINNITDYDSNYQFVRHVLLMDTTFPGNHGMWRAIRPEWLHAVGYDLIILWEIGCMALTWTGAIQLLRAFNQPAAFPRAKRFAVAGLVFGMLLWFLAFTTVGGEWFLMWQSRAWNGQEAAFRMFVTEGMVLGLLLLEEPQDEPK